jgi:hypothetical protein
MDADTLCLALDKVDELERLADTTQKDAIDYAFKAFGAALDHFAATEGDPFTRSRLAVVYGEQQPGDLHMVVTLPGAMREPAFTDKDVRRWIADAEMIARTLEDADCSEAYRKAFGSIYAERLLGISRVDWEHPTVVRVLLPLVMQDLYGNRPADADTAFDILSITLRTALVSDEVSERTRTVNG